MRKPGRRDMLRVDRGGVAQRHQGWKKEQKSVGAMAQRQCNKENL